MCCCCSLSSFIHSLYSHIVRRQIAQSMLEEDETIVTMTMFPLLGANHDFTRPHFEPNGPYAQSLYLPDEIINEHPRFGTLTRNIRLRREGKVCILTPLFMDTNTDPDFGIKCAWEKTPVEIDLMMSQSSPTQYFLPSPRQSSNGTFNAKLCGCDKDAEVPSIYMDAMGFGMGCCCMQCTFQARDIDEARSLYDHLAVLCPFFLALTAATPIVRGLLADTDVRWNIVSASVDDRTKEEKKKIAKSRYDSVSLYIHNNEEAKKNSDLNVSYDESAYNTLLENGIDEVLAKHVAHLFIRDPLVIFTDCREVDDNNESDHFENIQSTNWQTVRFKPPPPNSPIGWRVEFRVMEVQLSDFENAAFSVFIVLLTRVMLSYNLNFYMPLSKVDENMAKAHKRDAVTEEKFYFRKDPLNNDDPTIELMTLDEIINGSESKFIGLIPLMRKFLDDLKLDMEDRIQIEKYIRLVSKRATGELLTGAAYMRKTVVEHPAYNHDSIVNDEIAYDLVEAAERIAQGEYNEFPELFGDLFKDQ
jgi:glutamate--cysteine ligase catalytic subunit